CPRPEVERHAGTSPRRCRGSIVGPALPGPGTPKRVGGTTHHVEPGRGAVPPLGPRPFADRVEAGDRLAEVLGERLVDAAPLPRHPPGGGGGAPPPRRA